MSFKDRFLHSTIARVAYKFKFYMDAGIGQISWFTAKLPELMALVFLMQKFGYDPTETQIVGIVLSGVCILVLFGFCWKKSGLYDTEKYVVAEKDPVQNELLTAARIIIANEKIKTGTILKRKTKRDIK